jgi:hypothetical protein
VLVCTAAFMLLLEITVVSVALPSIQRDLRANLPDLLPHYRTSRLVMRRRSGVDTPRRRVPNH